MSLGDVLRLLARRWLVVLLGLVATGGGCYQVLERVGPDYQASSQMLFVLPPESTGAETPSNPLLNLPEGLATTASLVAGNLSTKDTERALAREGATADYAVALVPGAGPLLVITAKDKDPEIALATRDALMELVDAELNVLQTEQDAPQGQLISTTTAGVSSRAEVLPGSRMRALVAAAAAGVLATLLLAALTDRALGLLRRRSERREAPEADSHRDGDQDGGGGGTGRDDRGRDGEVDLEGLDLPRDAARRGPVEHEPHPPRALAG